MRIKIEGNCISMLLRVLDAMKFLASVTISFHVSNALGLEVEAKMEVKNDLFGIITFKI